MKNNFPGFAPHFDFGSKKEGADKNPKSKSRDKDLEGNKEKDSEGYGKEDGFTGNKMTIHQHEDGSYHTESKDEDGKTEKKEHASYKDAEKHMAEHFNESSEDGDDGDERGEGEDATEDYPSHKGGLGKSISSLMS